ncbi:hypothetical protein CTAYLR_001318 [Chrysophaeum taylorii]|uniref:Acetyltransferase n=1 Tax=Chrysophaeum taylorii TaxID=2483200 RepID=A0AAD7U583_9STRA|nr:hypothetical protein CTAYLR_001318 [Chrysophaeum taylorii]
MLGLVIILTTPVVLASPCTTTTKAADQGVLDILVGTHEEEAAALLEIEEFERAPETALKFDNDGLLKVRFVEGLKALRAEVVVTGDADVRVAVRDTIHIQGTGPVRARLDLPGASPECRAIAASATAHTIRFAPDASWGPPTITVRSSPTGGFPVVVEAGRGTYGLDRVEVWGWGTPTRLKVGNFSSFAPNVVVFLGGDHRLDWTTTFPFPAFHPAALDLVDKNLTDGPHAATKGDVLVGSDVWVGYGATLLSGVTIGHGAVVGARAVVAKDVPPYAVVVGNPARVVKFRFDNATRRSLLDQKWWDWPDNQIIHHFPTLLAKPRAFF